MDLEERDILQRVAAGELSVDEASALLDLVGGDTRGPEDPASTVEFDAEPLISPPPRAEEPPRRKERGTKRRFTFDDAISFAIHGIDADYIRRVRASGLEDLSPDQLIAFGIHGVEPERVAEFRTLGFDLDADDVIAFAIHGLDPQLIRRFRSANATAHLSADQLLAAAIHGVEPEAFEALADLWDEDEE